MINDFGGLMIEEDTEYLRKKTDGDHREEIHKESWNKEYIKILKNIVKNRSNEQKKNGLYMSSFQKIGVKNPLGL
jgi:hypothetical protein